MTGRRKGAGNHDPGQAGVQRVLGSRGEVRSFYDKISKVYDLLAERSEGPMRQAGLRMLAPRPGDRILEIGAGTGQVLMDLAGRVGARGLVCGVDLSAGMLAQAASRRRRAGPAAPVVLAQGDAIALPFGPGTFHGVFMSFTLELFDTPEIPAVLAECRRVLRSGGRLQVVGLSREGEPGLALQAYEWGHRHFPNLLDCRPIRVARAVEAAGFIVRRRRRLRMWVPVVVVLGEAPRQTGESEPGVKKCRK